jgi:hypothetical protein
MTTPSLVTPILTSTINVQLSSFLFLSKLASSPSISPHLLRIYTDRVYNRSQILVVGCQTTLPQVIANVVTAVLTFPTEASDSNDSLFSHNHSGLVDLIPISPIDDDNLDGATQTCDDVYRLLSPLLPNIVRYGPPTTLDLPSARRETSFFKPKNGDKEESVTMLGASRYTSGLNFRLSCDVNTSRRIAKPIRDQFDKQVEAMSFAYSSDTTCGNESEIGFNIYGGKTSKCNEIEAVFAIEKRVLFSYRPTPTLEDCRDLITDLVKVPHKLFVTPGLKEEEAPEGWRQVERTEC